MTSSVQFAVSVFRSKFPMTEAGFFEKVQNQHLVAAAAADKVRWVVEFLTRGGTKLA